MRGNNFKNVQSIKCMSQSRNKIDTSCIGFAKAPSPWLNIHSFSYHDLHKSPYRLYYKINHPSLWRRDLKVKPIHSFSFSNRAYSNFTNNLLKRGSRPTFSFTCSVGRRFYVSFVVDSSSKQKENFFEECEKVASRLSFTRIQDYKTCPQRFRYKYLEKRRTPMTEHAVRGSALHEAISVFGRWHARSGNANMKSTSHSVQSEDYSHHEAYEEFEQYPEQIEEKEEEPSNIAKGKLLLSEVSDDVILKLKEEQIKTLSENEMKKLMIRIYDVVWKNNMKQLSYQGTKEQLREFYKQGKKMLWKFYARESSMLHQLEDYDRMESVTEYHSFDEIYGFNEEAPTLVSDNTIRRPELVEKHFSFYVKTQKRNIRVTGIFDRIDRAYSQSMDLQNDIIVVEYKTSLKEYSKEMHKNQVKLYTYAYERVHGIRPSKGMLFSISEDDFHIYEPKPRDRNDVEQTIIRVSDSIASGYFRAKPDFNKCKFCDFRKICPFSLYQRNPNIKTDIEDYSEQADSTQQNSGPHSKDSFTVEAK